MPELTLNNIDRISADIKKQEITFSHLLDELIDHVCCDVENEMKKGLSFADAYQKVKKRMGPRRLKEIQEETLFAVDTKYRKMKNTMKISGIAGTLLLGFAAIFKIQHWPGAGIMLDIGALTLAFVFMPTALGVLWKETHSSKRLFLFISAFVAGTGFIAGTLFKIQHWPGAGYILMLGALVGILFFIPSLLVNRMANKDNKHKQPVYFLGAMGLILYIAGMLFKIQHWPMATLFMITGLILISLVAFPWYTWLTWKEESYVSSVFIFLVIASLLIIIPGALVNLSLQHSYQNMYYPNLKQQDDMYDYLYSHNRSLLLSYRDSSDYPQMEIMHKRTASIIQIISNIQEKLVQESEGEPGKPALGDSQITRTDKGIRILYYELSRPLDTRPVQNILIPGSSSRQTLDLSFAGFKSYLDSIPGADNMSKYNNMIDPENFLPGENQEDRTMTLLSALHSLEIMKNGILTVESCVLNNIVKNK